MLTLSKKIKFLAGIALAGFFSFVGFGLSGFFPTIYDVSKNIPLVSQAQSIPQKPQVTHLKTPPVVKGIYMTSWVAGDKNLREKLVKLIDETELNAVVIDVKDYTGRVFLDPGDEPILLAASSTELRMPDIKDFIKELHDKNIYVIARISTFQDAFIVKKRPDLAVKATNTKDVWKDFKGISWIDPGAQDFWDYILAVSRVTYDNGFDELNFDYIRFPSDGNMTDIYYPYSDGQVKADVIENFFAYLSANLKKDADIPLSADLFGMTTTNPDDLNIGQVLERAVPYFDYIDPMVYPSHYPTNFMGFKNPAEKPYEVVRYSLDHAVNRASTTPLKFRPWLQDFNLGAIYTADMVKLQIQATYDAGLTSWIFWNASNKYTKDAFIPERGLQ